MDDALDGLVHADDRRRRNDRRRRSSLVLALGLSLGLASALVVVRGGGVARVDGVGATTDGFAATVAAVRDDEGTMDARAVVPVIHAGRARMIGEAIRRRESGAPRETFATTATGERAFDRSIMEWVREEDEAREMVGGENTVGVARTAALGWSWASFVPTLARAGERAEEEEGVDDSLKGLDEDQYDEQSVAKAEENGELARAEDSIEGVNASTIEPSDEANPQPQTKPRQRASRRQQRAKRRNHKQKSNERALTTPKTTEEDDDFVSESPADVRNTTQQVRLGKPQTFLERLALVMKFTRVKARKAARKDTTRVTTGDETTMPKSKRKLNVNVPPSPGQRVVSSIEKARRDLLRNPFFAADFGEHVFDNFEKTDEEIVKPTLSQAAVLKGLAAFRTRYRMGADDVSEDDDDSVLANLGVAPKTCKIVYFYHIPRTGGGSLLAHMAQNGVDIQRFERSKYAQEGSELEMYQQLDEDEHWKRVVKAALRPGSHVIAHHVGRSGILDMEVKLQQLRKDAQNAQCQLRTLTVLREPTQRDMSAVAHNSNTTASVMDLNGQVRFLLVNAGNERSRRWPKVLTSENANLPNLLGDAKGILSRNFDWMFAQSDLPSVRRQIDRFYSIQSPPGRTSTDDLDSTLEMTHVHQSDYDVASADGLGAVRHRHDTAQESGWLDDKLYRWVHDGARSG